VSRISRVLPEQISTEAHHRCEYCQTSRRLIGIPLVVDHVIPRSAGGSNARENLVAACYRCNEFKGSKTRVIDPPTGELVALFNPRTQNWSQHLAWANGGTHIIGRTSTGRATVLALRLNNEYVVEARSLWIARNWHPPSD
jgi:hypothetical protein